MSKSFAVIGNPITHSLSPQLHQKFAQQFDLKFTYEKIQLSVDQFETDFFALRERGFSGMNVTVPFKMKVLSLVDHVSFEALSAQSANTLTIDQSGKISAQSTDGEGLLRDLKRLKAPLKDARIAILGAGGAARAILLSLFQQAPKAMVIFNRSFEKAQQLISDFSSITCLSLGDYKNDYEAFDLILNATSASLKNEKLPLSALKLNSEGLAYDLVYSLRPTPFMCWAQQQNVRATDGWGMLVEQAASAFYIWHGVYPDTKKLLESKNWL